MEPLANLLHTQPKSTNESLHNPYIVQGSVSAKIFSRFCLAVLNHPRATVPTLPSWAQPTILDYKPENRSTMTNGGISMWLSEALESEHVTEEEKTTLIARFKPLGLRILE